jgi:probable HAF family extracellular repeat protein
VPIVRSKHRLIILGCAALLIAAAAAFRHIHHPRILYQVTFLPTMDGVEVWPHALNDSGRVAATVRMPDGTVRVVLWDKSGRTEDRATFAQGSEVAAVVLNNAGQAACTVRDPNRTWSSFFWDADGRRYTLETPDYNEVRINAMNNRGQVVGYQDSPRYPRHAFRWDKTAGMLDLHTFGSGESFACGINDAGQIVGFLSRAPRQWRAFLLDPNLEMRDLGPTKPGLAATCQINNQGFVVGRFGSAEDETCVSIWTAETGASRLASTGDWLAVRALNDANQFILNVHHNGLRIWKRQVGNQTQSTFWGWRTESLLWESANNIRSLNRHLGRTDIRGFLGYDLNKNGTIVGSLFTEGSSYPRAVLLEPIQ